MAVTTADLQRLLDDAWDAAPPAVNTLREQLRTFEKEIGSLVSRGSLQSVSKSSASQSYFDQGSGNLTQAELARAWRELINLFDRVSVDLVDAGTATSDEEVYAVMKEHLFDSPTECSTDFTEARR